MEQPGGDHARALVAVLAGGLSRRMGASKPSVELAGRPLISYPLAAARAAGLEVVIVAKRASALPALEGRVLYEPDAPRHPLCGIVAALRHARSAVIAVGCDMPFVSGELLARMLAEAKPEAEAAEADVEPEAEGERGAARGGGRAVVLAAGGRVQPLPALYQPGQLARLEAALARERPQRAVLEELAPHVIGERELERYGDPERLCFSVNDRGDLERARAWLAG